HTGVDRRPLADNYVVADDAPLFEQAVVLDGDVATDDRLAQARVLADVGVAPDDRVADLCVLVDHREVPNAHWPVDEDPGLELALVADVSRAGDPDVVTDLDVVAYED